MDTKSFINTTVPLFNTVKLTLLCYALYIGVNTVTQLRALLNNLVNTVIMNCKPTYYINTLINRLNYTKNMFQLTLLSGYNTDNK